jgi:hypothetical protein
MKLSLGIFMSAVDRSREKMQAVCALRTCPNKMLMRIVAQSQVGIRVGQLWYCGVDCFAESAFNRFTTLSSGRVVEMPHSPRLSIGLAMLSKGYLTNEQLRFAMAQSQSLGERLEVALVRLGLANEWQLTSARAAQWGYPVLGQDRMGRAVEADIPPTLLRAYSAAPLHYSAAARRLVLGFVYRVEHSLLVSMEQITGCRVEPCFITPTEFEEQMARLTAAPEYEESTFDDSLTPGQMARTLGRLAVEVSAREARFAHSRNYAWARLSGKRGKIDVIFFGKIGAEAEKTRNSSLLEESIGSLG